MVYRDCLLYLRGLYYLSITNWIDGLRDFYAIVSNDLFPRSLLCNEIFPAMSGAQKEQLKEQGFYRSAPELRRIVEDNHEGSHLHVSFNGNSFELLETEYESLADLGTL